MLFGKREREWEYKDDKSKHFIDYSHRVTADSEKLVELLPTSRIFSLKDSKRERKKDGQSTKHNRVSDLESKF